MDNRTILVDVEDAHSIGYEVGKIVQELAENLRDVDVDHQAELDSMYDEHAVEIIKWEDKYEELEKEVVQLKADMKKMHHISPEDLKKHRDALASAVEVMDSIGVEAEEEPEPKIDINF